MKQVWIRHPALIYGLSVLLGTLFVLQSPLALLPFLFLLNKRHVFKVTLFFLLTIAYLYHAYSFPPSGSLVTGRFRIQSVRESKGFTGGWSYRGVLKTQKGRLCCSIHSKTHFAADRAYTISGVAFSQGGPYYSIKGSTWDRIEKSFSLAEWRFFAKKWVKDYIERHIKQKRSAHFLTGMVTGSLEDPVMLQEFGTLGLSHIMAISGFHFALLTLAFHLLLRLFLPPKAEALLLMFVLTAYLIFIGDSPSIQRAWIAAMIFLLGQLLERPPRPLNSLGAALLTAILLNPLSATTLSFQLSFLATAGILVLYAPLNRLLQLWLPILPLQEALERPLLWQHAYLASLLIREALSLSAAVHLALLPLLLYYFHAISLNSLVYNLFFPFCSSIALFLFLLGILTGGLLHPLNGWYCERLLALTESPPLLFKTLYIENLSPLLIVIYITSLFILTICYNNYYETACRRE
ncbi:MAG: ComEC/Rec2 family competence protein [Chlamydiales bacterium]|nr:ComEC/Rec2 family competence protein [Chlamydiales bacterium]